jgi:undecaprenyl-diphosphatase
MDPILYLHALIMGVVEGLTEFLPVSSTGHLILTGSLLDFLDKEKRDVFEIFIQLGAMLAVVWEYRNRFLYIAVALPNDRAAQRFVANRAVAFVPAAVVGLAVGGAIKAHLFNPVAVALALIVGGLVILWAERRSHVVRVAEVADMRWTDALKIGLVQCLALIPGTSRSGATIIGGLLCGLSRKAATEFSFFLGVPTLAAASLYSLHKSRHLLDPHDWGVFAVGFVAAFIAAFVMVRALLRFIANHTFVIFAWYRIVFGGVILLTAYLGIVDWSR